MYIKPAHPFSVTKVRMGCRCESMGKEVVYVSGRVRAPGEMNGKSGNMNNALSQIYPKEYAIPGNEVVCVFDADQVAKRDFFLKTLPYFDAGEAPPAHWMALDMCSCLKGPVYVYAIGF